MRFFRIILWLQTGYYLPTAIWALVDIRSFMDVTGPKKDVWLVKTVAVLLIAISFCFLVHLLRKSDWLPAAVLAISCCTGLAAIDVIYSSQHVISKIYLADAGIQFILIICWTIIIFRKITDNKNKRLNSYR